MFAAAISRVMPRVGAALGLVPTAVPPCLSAQRFRTSIALTPTLPRQPLRSYGVLPHPHVPSDPHDPLRSLYLLNVWKFPDSAALMNQMKGHRYMKDEFSAYQVAVAQKFGGAGCSGQVEFRKWVETFERSRSGFNTLPPQLQERRLNELYDFLWDLKVDTSKLG